MRTHPPRSQIQETLRRTHDLFWAGVSKLYAKQANDPEAMQILEELVDEREAAKAQETGEDGDCSAWQESEPPYGEGDDVSNPALRPTRKMTPHEVAREEYDSYVFIQYATCESELSFHLNEKDRAAGIDVESLFSGPVSRVKSTVPRS